MIRKAQKTDIPDTAGVTAALRRAAKRALDLGLQTGTPVYVWQDGRIVDLTKVARRPRRRRQRRRTGKRGPSRQH